MGETLCVYRCTDPTVEQWALLGLPDAHGYWTVTDGVRAKVEVPFPHADWFEQADSLQTGIRFLTFADTYPDLLARPNLGYIHPDAATPTATHNAQSVRARIRFLSQYAESDEDTGAAMLAALHHAGA